MFTCTGTLWLQSFPCVLAPPDSLACLFSESRRWIGGGEGDDGVVLRRAAVVGVPRADRAGAADARGAAQGAADRGTVFSISGHGTTCA